MQILTVMAIKDVALGIFHRPVFVIAPAQGLRAFEQSVNDPEHEISKKPEDYELWQFGRWTDDGSWDLVAGERVARGADLKRG